MPAYILNGGAWTQVSKIYILNGGAWTQVQNGYILNGGAWTQFYAATNPPPPVPPAPTFSPNGSTFTCSGDSCALSHNFSVTVTCSSGTIHYTTNGTTPTTSSPTVTSGSAVQVKVSRSYPATTVTLKAMSSNSTGNSNTTSANFTYNWT